MVTSNSEGRITWRQLLKRHGRVFLRCLRESGRVEHQLAQIADQLAGFLIESLDHLVREWPDAPKEFWNRIPDVRSCCSDLATFERPLAAEAYAYVHLLERYRRTWKTLEYLCKHAVLPLGIDGVWVLDIGAGPAPSLYAIADFYDALTHFADKCDILELKLPPPQLSCVEQSASMVRFFHRFSEYSKRHGPFGPIEMDFTNLQLASKRAWYRSQNEYEQYWDDETGQYEEFYDPVTAAAQAERLYRFRLVVFSNFLTLEADVRHFESELRDLFEDLKAGGVVLILGATGDSYQKIYEQISSLARSVGLKDADWHNDDLGELDPNDQAAAIIKGAQHRVYQHLERLVAPDSLQREPAWPDYWNASPSLRARPRFALRVYRSGRWPTTKRAA